MSRVNRGAPCLQVESSELLSRPLSADLCNLEIIAVPASAQIPLARPADDVQIPSHELPH